MSGADALKAENIIKMFEGIKGRKATSEEIPNVERKLSERPQLTYAVGLPTFLCSSHSVLMSLKIIAGCK